MKFWHNLPQHFFVSLFSRLECETPFTVAFNSLFSVFCVVALHFDIRPWGVFYSFCSTMLDLMLSWPKMSIALTEQSTIFVTLVVFWNCCILTIFYKHHVSDADNPNKFNPFLNFPCVASPKIFHVFTCFYPLHYPKIRLPPVFIGQYFLHLSVVTISVGQMALNIQNIDFQTFHLKNRHSNWISRVGTKWIQLVIVMFRRHFCLRTCFFLISFYLEIATHR